MISLGSLSAFSAGGATAPLSRPQSSSAATADRPVRVRAQSASPPGMLQASPQLAAPPDKKLPRGSLLNLQV